jgi:hypothetical protein
MLGNHLIEARSEGFDQRRSKDEGGKIPFLGYLVDRFVVSR